MMTPEFLHLIASVRDQFRWTLTADTGRHSERRSAPRFHLQAFPVNRSRMALDPIRAAVYARSGVVPDTWAEAALVLGIEVTEAGALAAAASDRTWTGSEGKRLPVDELLELREQLLEAVGLILHSPGRRIPEDSHSPHEAVVPEPA